MALLTSNWVSDLITVSLVLFGVFYVYAKYKLSYWNRRGVPSPPANILFGNLRDVFLMKKSPSQILEEIYNYAGSDAPYVGLYVFHRPILLIRDPELIKLMMIKDFESFGNRQFARYIKNDIASCKNMFSLEKTKWKYVRSKLSPVMTLGKLKKIAPLIIETSEEMLKYIEAQLNNENSTKSLRMKDTVSKYMTDTIASLAFGVKTNSFEIPEPEFRVHANSLSKMDFRRTLELFSIFFFSEISDLIDAKMLGKSTPFFRNLFWESMEIREKSGNTRGDLIDILINLKNSEQHPEYEFAGDNLFAQSAVFFMAGLDTTSLTIALEFLELAKNPEFQDRARREVEENFEEHGVTLAAFQEMKYINQVILETLRMHPPAPILDRIATKDYKIPGSDLIIKEGQSVYFSLIGLHHDSKHHPDPLKFDPDRFSNERKKLITPMTYIPFGEGPKICIGQKIALLQSVICLAMVLYEYEFTVDTEKETVVDPKGTFLLSINEVNLLFKKIIRDR